MCFVAATAAAIFYSESEDGSLIERFESHRMRAHASEQPGERLDFLDHFSNKCNGNRTGEGELERKRRRHLSRCT